MQFVDLHISAVMARAAAQQQEHDTFQEGRRRYRKKVHAVQDDTDRRIKADARSITHVPTHDVPACGGLCLPNQELVSAALTFHDCLRISHLIHHNMHIRCCQVESSQASSATKPRHLCVSVVFRQNVCHVRGCGQHLLSQQVIDSRVIACSLRDVLGEHG